MSEVERVTARYSLTPNEEDACLHTGSVHLADILLQEIAKYARKVFDSPPRSLPGFAWSHKRKSRLTAVCICDPCRDEPRTRASEILDIFEAEANLAISTVMRVRAEEEANRRAA